MPQPTIKPYQPAKRTEEYVYRQGDVDDDGEIQDEAPLVMTIRQSLTHGEMDPIRTWFRSLELDFDEMPESDDQSPEARRTRRRLLKERSERSENRVAWPLIGPYVLRWNVLDAEGQPVPPPAETEGESFALVPNEAFGEVLYHFLGVPQRRVESARKASSASGDTDAPSLDTSSPSEPETTP